MGRALPLWPLLALLAACSPEETLSVVLEDAPANADHGLFRIDLGFDASGAECADLVAPLEAPNALANLAAAGSYQGSRGTWPAKIELRLARPRPPGRVFGVATLWGLPYATFCSDAVDSAITEIGVRPSWVRTRAGPTLAEARRFPTLNLVPGNQLLALGGTAARVGEAADLIDPISFAVSPPLAPLVPRSLHSATSLADGSVLICGGTAVSRGDLAMSRCEVFSAERRRFELAASMSLPRRQHAAVLLADGRVLVTGGLNSFLDKGEVFASAELWDPDGGQWAEVGAMSRPRQGHTSTLLPDGRVLIAGGMVGSVATTETELFDPRTNLFAPGPPMAVARSSHVAVPLGDGRTLVAGGSAIGAELFDPDAGGFIAAGDLLRGEYGPCAARLPDGRVVVTGSERLVNLYDPATNQWSARTLLGRGRSYCAAFATAEGRVLVLGGSTATTELVEP